MKNFLVRILNISNKKILKNWNYESVQFLHFKNLQIEMKT